MGSGIECFGFALGGEYRREKSSDTPDLLIQNGDFRGTAALSPSSGKFNVKEFFTEVNAPILPDIARRLPVPLETHGLHRTHRRLTSSPN